MEGGGGGREWRRIGQESRNERKELGGQRELEDRMEGPKAQAEGPLGGAGATAGPPHRASRAGTALPDEGPTERGQPAPLSSVRYPGAGEPEPPEVSNKALPQVRGPLPSCTWRARPKAPWASGLWLDALQLLRS